MTNYIAVIHKEKKSDYGVSFPDFPGCITAGKSIDDAKDMAQEALLGHVTLMQEEGMALPEPNSLEAILQDKDYKGAAAYFIVDIKSSTPTLVRFNASMDANLLALVDKKAEELGMTRSGFFAAVVRKELELRK